MGRNGLVESSYLRHGILEHSVSDVRRLCLPEQRRLEGRIQQQSCVTACACEHVCGGAEPMNNGCRHEVMAGEIRRDNVNKKLFLVHLSGRRWASVTGE